MRKNISPTLIGVRAHPLVEHAAVNRAVVGSSPTRGAENPQIHVCGFFVVIFQESIVLFSFQTFSHIEWRFQILL